MQKNILFISIAALALCACSHSHDATHDHSEHDHETHEHAHGHVHEHGHVHSADEHDGHAHSADEHAHEAAASVHSHAHEGHTHASDEIIVEHEIAERFGLKVDTVKAGDFVTTLRVSGSVANSGEADAVVSSPTAGIVHFVGGANPGMNVRRGSTIATVDAAGTSGGDTNKAAKASLDVAKAEYERIATLYKDQLATIGELNAALAAYRTAEAAYSPNASSGTATSPIAGVLTSLVVREGQYIAAGEVIATIAAEGNLTLRIDIPQKHYSTAASFKDAVLEFSYFEAPVSVSELGGKRLGTATIPSGTSSAYIPIYFSIPRGSGIVAGSTCTAYLIGAPRSGVVTLPVSALSEQQGQYFVYEQLDAEGFAKIPVTIGASDGRRVEILSGVHPGMSIVVEGTTTVRLAESGANIPEGHSHNH